MKYAIFICALIFSQVVYAGDIGAGTECNIEEAKKYVLVTLSEEEENCKDLLIYFPKELPSRPGWVYSYPLPIIQIYEKNSEKIEGHNQYLLKFRLRVDNSIKEGYSTTSFCLPDDLIQKSVLTILYEESKINPKRVKYGNTELITELSFCMAEITIDNLYELMEQSKQQKEEE